MLNFVRFSVVIFQLWRLRRIFQRFDFSNNQVFFQLKSWDQLLMSDMNDTIDSMTKGGGGEGGET